MTLDFKILNWNIGGSKFLIRSEPERSEIKGRFNKELAYLLDRHRPHVVTLQEAVQYGRSLQDQMIDEAGVPGYQHHYFPLIDSDRFSFKSKWNKVKAMGGWGRDTFFSQGNAFLIRRDVRSFPLWDLSGSRCEDDGNRHFIEQVNLDSGLYFGDRNTEPRAALVSHFIFNPGERPLDVFAVNVHLTTLLMEREGIPSIDADAARIRLGQVEVLLQGIVSRYNLWRQQGYPGHGPKRDGEACDRHPPVWVLAGDFNFTPQSQEYQLMQRMNFIDAIPSKGAGTKAKGAGNQATLTVDYVFAGPKFISLDPLIAERDLQDNSVDHTVQISDHYPMFASIPLNIP